MGGGAWPFLVGGVICLLNCDNERDLVLLNSNVKLLPSEATEQGSLRETSRSPLVVDL